MQLAVTGEPIGAEEAARFGLINELVEPGTALDAALALADRITANAPIAVRLSRAVVRAATSANDDELWRLSARALAEVAKTDDFAEGPRAFIEKRPPNWTGH